MSDNKQFLAILFNICVVLNTKCPETSYDKSFDSLFLAYFILRYTILQRRITFRSTDLFQAVLPSFLREVIFVGFAIYCIFEDIMEKIYSFFGWLDDWL